jgi:hypothetical protein
MNKYFIKEFIFLFLLGIPLFAYAQTRTVQGTVFDADSNEKLRGASVWVVETKSGTVTDEKGNYTVSLLQGNFTLRFSYVGYESSELKINAQSSLKQNIRLKSNNLLKEVVISSLKKNDRITNPSMGVEKLSMEEIRLLPAIMGEVDILKTLQLLPGVQSVSESSSGFSVRGGSPDQNLIVLDNTTVYNPSHQMGFFSTFNNDVISDIELYKGHFPFRHGGRLSSLLEVKTRSEIPSHTHATGGIGLISSRLMMEGPWGEKTSWMVAGRRTYADLFLVFSSNKNLRNTTLYFYDLNGKLTHRFSEKDKLELNIYNGLDNMKVSLGYFKYGNTVSSLSWNHVFSQNLFGKFSIHLSDYTYQLGAEINDINQRLQSNISDWMLRADFHHTMSDRWNLSYGVSGIHHFFNQGKAFVSGIFQNDTTIVLPQNKALEYAAYLSNEQKFNEKLSLKYGLRFSVFQNTGTQGQVYSSLEPGISAVYRLSEHSSFKAAYSHNTQYLQLANNSASGSPLDIWFSAGPNVKPQQVDLYSVGYFHHFNDNMYETSVELYAKNLKNVIDFREHSELLLSQDLEKEIRTGTGKSYGIETMVKKNSGRLTGFINYTLSRSERTIPEVNQGKTYLAPYDKTHAINGVFTYHFSPKINLSAVWVFATGMPTTYPTGRFAVGDEYFPIYSGRNEYRKPNYHRMDLSLNYIPRPNAKKRWQGEWNFSLYNVYNRKNPWTIMLQQNETTGIPYAEMMYLFGIVPSITYNFKF